MIRKQDATRISIYLGSSDPHFSELIRVFKSPLPFEKSAFELHPLNDYHHIKSVILTEEVVRTMEFFYFCYSATTRFSRKKRAISVLTQEYNSESF
eukprot:844219-Amphidinium_carterae.1